MSEDDDLPDADDASTYDPDAPVVDQVRRLLALLELAAAPAHALVVVGPGGEARAALHAPGDTAGAMLRALDVAVRDHELDALITTLEEQSGISNAEEVDP